MADNRRHWAALAAHRIRRMARCIIPAPRRFAACTSIAVLLLGAAGCARAPDDSRMPRFGLASFPATLDPRFATDAASTRIDRLIYERLVDFDDAYKPVPALARWQRRSPTRYRFTLTRGEHYFHDGRRLTMADVQATYRSVLDPQMASPHRASLTVIKKMEIVDDRNIDFILDKPDILFPGRLVVGILPADLIKKNYPFSRQPVGSGPFRFRSWPDEGHLVLERLADHLPFEFVYVPDPTVRVLKMLRGEVDMMQNDLPPELVNYLSTKREVSVTTGPGTNFTYLGFNMRDPMVGRLAVRKAIAHALDRKKITETVFGGTARLANSILAPDHWAGNAALTGYDYDPEQARRLLREAGFSSSGGLKITYKTSADPFRIRLATIIQQQLKQVGIDVDIRSYDWGTFYGDIKAGRFQMYSLSWVGIKNPDIFRYVFYSEAIPPQGANRGRYSDKEVDHLIEAAEQAPNFKDQARLYRKLQQRLLEQLPYVPLWYENHVFIARRGITGYTIARDGNYDGLIHVAVESSL